jgi:hypothetical protein
MSLNNNNNTSYENNYYQSTNRTKHDLTIARFVKRTMFSWHKRCDKSVLRRLDDLYKGDRDDFYQDHYQESKDVSLEDITRVALQAVYMICSSALDHITKKTEGHHATRKNSLNRNNNNNENNNENGNENGNENRNNNKNSEGKESADYDRIMEAFDKVQTFVTRLISAYKQEEEDHNRHRGPARRMKRTRRNVEEPLYPPINVKTRAKIALGASFQFAEEYLVSSFFMGLDQLCFVRDALNQKAEDKLFKQILGTLGNKNNNNKQNGKKETRAREKKAEVVRSILREWHRDKRLVHLCVLGNTFDMYKEAYLNYSFEDKNFEKELSDPVNLLDETKWLDHLGKTFLRVDFRTLFEPNIKALYAMCLLASSSVNSGSRSGIMAWHFHKERVPMLCFRGLYYSKTSMPSDQEDAWETHIPRTDDRRFHWVRSAPKRLLLQRFADRCPFEAQGLEPEADKDAHNLEEFDGMPDPLDLESLMVKVASGHCYKLSGLTRQLNQSPSGTGVIVDPMTRQTLPRSDTTRVKFLDRDGSWTTFELAMVLLSANADEYLMRWYDEARLKAFCAEISSKILENNRQRATNKVLFIRAKADGSVFIKGMESGLEGGILFPRNIAGNRLLSMFLAVASLVRTDKQAREFLSLLSTPDKLIKSLSFNTGENNESNNNESNNNEYDSYLSVMVTIYAMYKILNLQF